MNEMNLWRRWPRCAAATAISAVGLLAGAAPAQAFPEVPLAPGDCQQWGFPGPVTLQLSSGEFVSFTSNGANAGGPAKWNNPNGTSDSGTINGNISNTGGVQLRFIDDNQRTDTLAGQVNADGSATGNVPNGPASLTWASAAPRTCAQAAAAPAPVGKDSDGDGLSDSDELKSLTNPFLGDTDFDGVSDGDERKNGTSPLNALSN